MTLGGGLVVLGWVTAWEGENFAIQLVIRDLGADRGRYRVGVGHVRQLW